MPTKITSSRRRVLGAAAATAAVAGIGLTGLAESRSSAPRKGERLMSDQSAVTTPSGLLDRVRSFIHRLPAGYPAQAPGTLRHHPVREGDYAVTGVGMQPPLGEAGAENVDMDLVSVDPVGLEVAADYQTLRSPETYLGYGQATGMASPDGL